MLIEINSNSQVYDALSLSLARVLASCLAGHSLVSSFMLIKLELSKITAKWPKAVKMRIANVAREQLSPENGTVELMACER